MSTLNRIDTTWAICPLKRQFKFIRAIELFDTISKRLNRGLNWKPFVGPGREKLLAFGNNAPDFYILPRIQGSQLTPKIGSFWRANNRLHGFLKSTNYLPPWPIINFYSRIQVYYPKKTERWNRFLSGIVLNVSKPNGFLVFFLGYAFIQIISYRADITDFSDRGCLYLMVEKESGNVYDSDFRD